MNTEPIALPCPFCGGTNVSTLEGSTFRWRVAMCNECGATSGEVRKQTIGGGTDDEWTKKAHVDAIVRWNERAGHVSCQQESEYEIPDICPPIVVSQQELEHWRGNMT